MKSFESWKKLQNLNRSLTRGQEKKRHCLQYCFQLTSVIFMVFGAICLLTTPVLLLISVNVKDTKEADMIRIMAGIFFVSSILFVVMAGILGNIYWYHEEEDDDDQKVDTEGDNSDLRSYRKVISEGGGSSGGGGGKWKWLFHAGKRTP